MFTAAGKVWDLETLQIYSNIISILNNNAALGIKIL
jgi:hypothetical protein